MCDPCRVGSKLGTQEGVSDLLGGGILGDTISGIHVHNNCLSSDLSELASTIERIRQLLTPRAGVTADMCEIAHIPHCLEWINLGGGYLFDQAEAPEELRREFDKLHDYGLSVILEPGASLVRDGGFLVASVIDIFRSDGDNVAVLDTSVNHAPEVLEYYHLEDDESGPYPSLAGHAAAAPYEYHLVGSTCLAGDVFNSYRFERPLRIDDKIVFCEMGAYTLVKSHMFNGVNLPSIYLQNGAGAPKKTAEFTYEAFIGRLTGTPVNGEVRHEAV